MSKKGKGEQTPTPAPAADPGPPSAPVAEHDPLDGALATVPADAGFPEPFSAEYEFNGNKSRVALQSQKLTLPGIKATSNKAVKERLQTICSDLQRCGHTAYNRKLIHSLKEDLMAGLTRARALSGVLSKQNAADLANPPHVRNAFADEIRSKSLAYDKAMTSVLEQVRPQETALRSILALFELSRCEGAADHLNFSNIDPVTTETTRARGEYSFKELPEEQYVGGYVPLLQSAVSEDGTPYPITFTSLSSRYVYQTRGSAIVLGADFDGLLDFEWWANKASQGGAVVFANCDPEFMGPEPWTPQSKAKLQNTFFSDNPALKAAVLCGNHPNGRKKSRWEKQNVMIYPSFVYAGQLYNNEYAAQHLCFTVPPTNPMRDRLVGKWFDGLACPWLRDRAEEMADLPMPILTEISNSTLDGINVVFNCSRTAHAGGEHSCELELAVNLARAVVQHWMLMQGGKDLTKEEAEAVGRELNAIFQCLAGASHAPFLKASCDSTKSRIEQQIQRKPNGDPILGPDNQPVPTGKKVMVHEIQIEFRVGAEYFEVHFLP